jgi:hypothetical protein
MMVSLERRVWRPILLRSTPSRSTLPSSPTSMSRKRRRERLDLPAPVRPQIPIFSP